MHYNNRVWLSSLKKKYPSSFRNRRVLELGSGDTTGDGVIRSYFDKSTYIGVDIVGQERGVYGVDVVSKAKDTKFKRDYFDTLICFSMLEHDPTWKQSISHNIQFLKPGAMIFLSFGSNGNRRHDPEPWESVKFDDFLNFCSKLPINIIDAFFEEERYGYDCEGVFDLIAQKRGNSKTAKKFTTEMIRPVRPRPFLRKAIADLLYLMNRTRRNLRKATGLDKKYFSNN